MDGSSTLGELCSHAPFQGLHIVIGDLSDVSLRALAFSEELQAHLKARASSAGLLAHMLAFVGECRAIVASKAVLHFSLGTGSVAAVPSALTNAVEALPAAVAAPATTSVSGPPPPVTQVKPPPPQVVPTRRDVGRDDKKGAAEAEQQRKEQEAKRKREEEEARRRKQEEEEEEARRKEEEAERERLELEAAEVAERQRIEAEERARLEKEEEEEEQRRKEEEEAEARRREEEEAAAAAAAEEELRLREEEEQRKREEEEQQKKREEERLRKEKEEADAAAAAAAAAAEAERVRQEEAKKAEESGRKVAPPQRASPVLARGGAPPPAVKGAAPRSGAAPPGGGPAVPASSPKTVQRRLPPPLSTSGGTAPRKQLSLSARKNCKQFKANFAQHATLLQESLALELELQSKVEFLTLAERCDEGGHKDGCGEVFFEMVMGGLVRNLIRLKGTPGRDELLKRWTTGAISLRFNPEQEQEWSTTFPEGDLELVCRGEPWTELDMIGADLVDELLGGAGGAPIAGGSDGAADPVAASVASFTPKFNKFAEQIAQVVGLKAPPTYKVDFVSLQADVCDQSPQPMAAGELFLQHVAESLAANIKRACECGPAAVTAIRSRWTSGVIELQFNEKQQRPWISTFLQGALVVSANPALITNGADYGGLCVPGGASSGVGDDLLDKVLDEETGLTLLSALNMKLEEENHAHYLEQMRAAMGIEFPVVVDVDFYELASYVDAFPGHRSTVGTVWTAVLANLLASLDEVIAQPDGLELLLPLWRNALLKLSFDDGLEADVWVSEFLDGDLILVVNPTSPALLDPVSAGADLSQRVFESDQ